MKMNKEDLKEMVCIVISFLVAMTVVITLIELNRLKLELKTGKEVSWLETFYIEGK